MIVEEQAQEPEVEDNIVISRITGVQVQELEVVYTEVISKITEEQDRITDNKVVIHMTTEEAEQVLVVTVIDIQDTATDRVEPNQELNVIAQSVIAKNHQEPLRDETWNIGGVRKKRGKTSKGEEHNREVQDLTGTIEIQMAEDNRY